MLLQSSPKLSSTTHMKTYEFKNLKVQFGSLAVSVSGTAKYQLESLESLGVDDSIIAFVEAKVRDWNYKIKSKEELNGLTKKEIEKIEDIVCETLNEDSELVEKLTSEW